MHIPLSQRNEIPATDIFVKALRRTSENDFSWKRGVIVLIHGGPGGNHTLYADIEDDLLKIFDVVMLDLRGCGLSRKSDVQYCTLDNHIDDLDIVLKTLNIAKPNIFGCSYGAIVALGYSIKYPDNVSKMILCSGAVSGEFIECAKKNLEKIGNSEQIEAAKMLWNGAFETQEQFSDYYKIMAPLYIYNKNQLFNSPITSSNIPYNIELVNFAFTTFLPKFDFRKQLDFVKVKTLIFSGMSDWLFDNSQVDILHQGIKNSCVINLKNCGHFPWKDRRIKFFSIIKKFYIK